MILRGFLTILRSIFEDCLFGLFMVVCSSTRAVLLTINSDTSHIGYELIRDYKSNNESYEQR